MSWLLRHQNRHHKSFTKFFHFGALPIKISGYASGLGFIIWWSLKKRFWSWKSGLLIGLEKIGGLDLLT